MKEVIIFLNETKKEVARAANSVSFFQYFIFAAVTYIVWGPFLLRSYASIDGEAVYTSGFLVVLYLLWVELFSKTNDMLNPVVTSSGLTSFWLKYKNIESELVLIFYSKIILLGNILVTFSLTTIVLKSLSLIKFNNSVYRVTLQILNRLRLKNKSLPLQ